jgi:hypothetical protein
MRLALAVLVASAPAVAEPLRIDASLHDTTARFTVELTVDTDGASFPAATADVDLPPRGVVTAATVTAEGHTHALALMPVAAADAAFEKLAVDYAPDPPWGVLLTGAAGSSATINIAAAGTHSVGIVLSIEAATCFARDQRFVEVPTSWRPLLATVEAPPGCTAHRDAVWLAWPAPRPDRIGTRGSRLSVTSGDVAKIELDLARELADIPADLHTAIVIDGSRSVRPGERQEQRDIVASYLRSAPHTLVQVISYARIATPLLPAWTATDTAATRADHALSTLLARNGSNIDAGLAAAATWLSRVGGTHRILLFTDERTARRLRDEDGTSFAAALPANTLVHVIALREAIGPLVRDDNVSFGALAAATGGIGVAGALGPDLDATLLLRPLTFDDVALHGDGWTDLALGDCTADRLPAGASCTWFARGTPTSGPITITGSLWHRKVTRYVRPDPTRARSLARELSTTGVPDEALQRDIDDAARAVNTVWSLFAAWGGHGGYGGESGFGHGFGTGGGTASSSIVDTIDAASILPTVDLSAQLAGPLAACGPAHATIELDLTLDEITDVSVSGPTGALRTCLEDAVWNTLVTVPDAPRVSHAHIAL